MGVLGLGPFLRKKCPGVIKSLNERFCELKGSRIAIDGTLITQRLHFAPAPHPYKHVIGWYRIINELQSSGVVPICIFDGKERTAAKRAEVERRREALQVITVRGALEKDRLTRLRKLTASIGAQMGVDTEADDVPLSEASEEERQRIVAAFRSILVKSPQRALIPTPTSEGWDPSLADTPTDRRRAIMAETYGEFDESDISAILSDNDITTVRSIRKADEEVITAMENLTIEPPTPPAAAFTGLSDMAVLLEEALTTQTVAAQMDEPTEVLDESGQVSKITSDLEELHAQYRNSLLQLKSLPHTHPTSLQEADLEIRADLNMSKTQYQLTEEEGQFWERLTKSTLTDDDLIAADELVQKSSVLFESYERRKNIPTIATYEESREIIRSMGVPCIETTGPYEAEALASSLVLNGLVDLVASEDTDILVYGAPLLRNITSRDIPLDLISGSDLPSELGLTQQQFIDFCILLGTDFSKRIKNLGPARAFKFVKEYGTIENILKNEPNYPPHGTSGAYLEQVDQARSVFRSLPPVPPMELLECQKTDQQKVKAVLQKYGFASEWTPWDSTTALAGNYFNDNPFATITF